MAQSTGQSPAALPSLGVYHAAEEGWGGSYGLSVLIPEGQEDYFHDWTKHAVDEAEGQANVATVGRFQAYSCNSAAHLTPGCSISDGRFIAGTLGGVVQREDGTRGVLSNAHVLAYASESGGRAYHPGRGDDPNARPFGEVVDFVALKTGGVNYVDAAVATYDPEKIKIEWPEPGQPGYVEGVTDSPDYEEVHEKVGRTTGHTQGRLTREGHLSWIDYKELGMLQFDDVMIFESEQGPFSRAGDSGSVIIGEKTRLASGLLFAGADTGGKYGTGTTLAIPIMKVLSTLKIQLLGGSGGGGA